MINASLTQRLPLAFPILLAIALCLSSNVNGQLTVNTTMTPQELVEDVLLGGGVTASNITFTGNAAARASFTAGNTNLGLDGGVILSTGTASEAANPASFFISTAHSYDETPDPDLMQISGFDIYDNAILEFDFIPTGDTLRFRYVFGSQEYEFFTCSSVNDAFGFFLSGPGINGPFTNDAINLAVIPGTNIPISINTVNSGDNADFSGYCQNANPNWQQDSIYFVDNQLGTTVAYNGFTVVMTAFALVTCGETYHIKLAIGDGGDPVYDSAVFLEAGSFSSSGQVIPQLSAGAGVDGNTMLEGCGPFELVFTRLGDLTEDAVVTLSTGGTAVEGTDYTPAFPSELDFPAGVETQSLWIDAMVTGAGPRTLEVNILQLIACSGQNLLTTFTFIIDSPPPLVLDSYDLNSNCGESHILDPQVSGGVGEYEYLWSTGETTPTIEVSPGVTTTYTLTLSDGCEVLDEVVDYTITLPIYPPLEVTMGPDVAIDCLGEDEIEVISVTGGDNTFTYEWTLNGDVVGNGPVITVPSSEPVWYVVTITEGCGTSIQDSLMVSTVPLDPIEITTTGDMTVICPGDTALMEIIGTTGGNGVYVYEWSDQNGQTVSMTTSYETVVDADHTFTITATDQCANEGSTTITTLLPVYAPFQVQLPMDMIICAGDSLELLAQVSGGSGYYFLEWHELDHTDPVLPIAPWNDTEYIVTAVDRCGEERTADIMIQVEHVTVDIIETNRGQDDWYLQASTTPYALTWVWDMGDGTRYRGPEVVHSYMDLEEHWVTLTITTPNGCEGLDSLLIRPPAHVYFPNAFTPDGDGHNDLFGPVGHYITDMELEIFDRWGNLIWMSNSMENWWDGSVNGSGIAPTGVYVYKYRLEGHYFPSKEGYGHVTLLGGSIDY